MIDRHAVHALLRAGQSTKEIAVQFSVAQRTIQRIATEPPVEEADDVEGRRRRRIGRPAVPGEVRVRLRDLPAAEPQSPPLYAIRRSDTGISLTSIRSRSFMKRGVVRDSQTRSSRLG